MDHSPAVVTATALGRDVLGTGRTASICPRALCIVPVVFEADPGNRLRNIPEHSQHILPWPSISNYIPVYRTISSYTQLYRNIYKHTQPYTKITKHTETYPTISKHTQTYPITQHTTLEILVRDQNTTHETSGVWKCGGDTRGCSLELAAVRIPLNTDA